jgi:hypothetical protein
VPLSPATWWYVIRFVSFIKIKRKNLSLSRDKMKEHTTLGGMGAGRRTIKYCSFKG